MRPIHLQRCLLKACSYFETGAVRRPCRTCKPIKTKPSQRNLFTRYRSRHSRHCRRLSIHLAGDNDDSTSDRVRKRPPLKVGRARDLHMRSFDPICYHKISSMTLSLRDREWYYSPGWQTWIFLKFLIFSSRFPQNSLCLQDPCGSNHCDSHMP